MCSGLNMLLKQASGVHVGGTVDVVLEEVVVSVTGVDVVVEELLVDVEVVNDDDDEDEDEDIEVEVVPPVTGVLVLGGDTQIVPPQVVPMIGVVAHELPVVPLTVDVVQLVVLLVTVEQVVMGEVQLDVELLLVRIQMVLAHVVEVTG